MQKQEMFRKIGNIITELNDQYQYLSQHPENLNDLELELFLANANFLADHIEILRKLNNIRDAQTPVTEAEPEQVPAPIQSSSPSTPIELPSIFTLVEEQETAFEFEQKAADELFDRELSAEELTVLDSKRGVGSNVSEAVKAVENTPDQVPVSDPVIESENPVPIAESFQEPAPAKVTINDVISAQVSTATVASRFHASTAADLKSIISLNDKLLFIKDLFNGYSLAYSEAIELVNRFDSLESADNFLQHNYAIKNKWENKPETVEKFYAILSRRFS